MGTNLSSLSSWPYEEQLFSGEIGELENFKPIVGYHFDVVGKLNLNNKLFLRTGLILVQKGGKYSYNRSTSDTLEYNLNSQSLYLEIPIHLGFNIFKGLKLITGPFISVPINIKSEVCINGNCELPPEIFPSSNTYDVGYTIGLAYNFNSGIILDFQFEHGFIQQYTDFISNFTIREFRISVGYYFNH